MESFFSRYRNALVLIAVLLAQVVGLAVQVRRPGPTASDKGSVRLIRSWVIGLVSPPERVLHSTGHGIRGLWSNYLDLIHVRQQNKDLKAQLDRLRLEEDSLAEDARQGQRLQTLLGFQEKYIYKTVAAQVIGTSGTEQSEVLLIDKGSRDGIRPDMPVITPDGIVGKTRDVFGHTSQVLEISDPTSGAGVILEKTRIRGVLRGDPWGQPEIVNVSPDERIQAGEPVLTSGGDAIYPRGLAVGVVDKVVPDPDGTLVSVLIKPAANLSRLEEVLVITNTGNQIPAQMQQDLSDAQQKASDILAERLPSRVDPNAPPSEQANTDQNSDDETGAAPPVRPPQPLHPDHYSPSDTPPAADLVPGQRITNAQIAPADSSGGTAGRETAKPATAPGANTVKSIPAAPETQGARATPSGAAPAGSAASRPAPSHSGVVAGEGAVEHPVKKPAAPTTSDTGTRSKPVAPAAPGAPPVPRQNRTPEPNEAPAAPAQSTPTQSAPPQGGA